MLPSGMAVLKDRSVVGSCVISVAEKFTVLVDNNQSTEQKLTLNTDYCNRMLEQGGTDPSESVRLSLDH